METARTLIAGWLPRTTEALVFSASEVQSRLFDLYGELPEGPALDVVKTWLSLTIERDLFGGEELAEMLSGLMVELSIDPSTV